MTTADMLAKLSSWAELANALGLGLAIALLVPLLIVCLFALIWRILPRRNRAARTNADIEQQIKTLRRHADREVTHRPRVRGNGSATPPAAHIKAPPVAHKPCGGGMCRHRADCADHYCPGRPVATPTSAQRHAQH